MAGTRNPKQQQVKEFSGRNLAKGRGNNVWTKQKKEEYRRHHVYVAPDSALAGEWSYWYDIDPLRCKMVLFSLLNRIRDIYIHESSTILLLHVFFSAGEFWGLWLIATGFLFWTSAFECNTCFVIITKKKRKVVSLNIVHFCVR